MKEPISNIAADMRLKLLEGGGGPVGQRSEIASDPGACARFSQSIESENTRGTSIASERF
jgi:hypothetical protein